MLYGFIILLFLSSHLSITTPINEDTEDPFVVVMLLYDEKIRACQALDNPSTSSRLRIKLRTGRQGACKKQAW